ncbi:DUF6475 domain-containing protein [Ramlibacter sp. MAHUQ-53]|uniref:DUF6475 domain-containing protein n=1 Tax=unclassified Ramlibacter TaxID=2617605 RepID=UPI003640EA67
MLTDALAFYGKDASPFALSVWWQACEPFAFEQVAKAITAHAMDPERGQFAPKPADVVRQLAGTATDRAMLAWGKAHSAMGSVGAYSDVVFDDPAIHAVIEDLGGWPKVCRWPVDELSYLQHRFCESYRAYAGRGTFEYPKRLPGDRSADAEYEKRGLPAPAPAVVGDTAKARLVYQGGGGGKAAISFVAVKALALEYRQAA